MKYIVEIVIFLSGAAVMILELCGSRILAPYVGTSIVVWSSLIGVILGSLSLGYFLGGKIADKQPNFKSLSFILFLSSFSILGIVIFKSPIFFIVQNLFGSLTQQTISSTVLMFVLPNIFLGMITPVAAKIKLASVKTAGETVGNLYAISTMGSIAGTFFAGFYLIEHFSITSILIGISVILFVLAGMLFGKYFRRLGPGVFLVLAAAAFFIDGEFVPLNIRTFESQYNHIQIREMKDSKSKREIRLLSVNSEWDSAMYLGSNDLVFDYSKYYLLTKKINPGAKKILMIGGGAYSVPKYFLEKYKNVTVDVVEIDPLLTQLSMQYFGLKRDPRLAIYHEDGRTFLNRAVKDNGKKYDVILIDAFKGYSIPFQLTTREAISEMKSMLYDNGSIMINIISSIDGPKGEFLRAEYQTYKTIFPNVAVLPVQDKKNGYITQNIMMLVLKNGSKNFNIVGAWKGRILNDKPVLTDDFAPVDQYIVKNF